MPEQSFQNFLLKTVVIFPVYDFSCPHKQMDAFTLHP